MTTELTFPKGHGLVRVAHNLRHHVINPWAWGTESGTDFWAIWSASTMIEAGAIDPDNYGWLTTGFSILAGSGADFISASDPGTTGGLNCDAAGDYIISPFVFGDYAHALQAGQHLGHLPTSLNMECYARLAANNDEEETGFGFVEAGVDDNALVKGDLMAFITSDGTNFSLESGAAAAVSDEVDDTSPHQFRIKATVGGTWEWWIDGVKQSSTLAIQTDLWPCAWAVGTKASTGANDPVVAWVHIWYE